MEEQKELELFNIWGDAIGHFSKALDFLQRYKTELVIVSGCLEKFEILTEQKIDPNLPRSERKKIAKLFKKFQEFRKSLVTHTVECSNTAETIRGTLENLGQLFKAPNSENLS